MLLKKIEFIIKSLLLTIILLGIVYIIVYLLASIINPAAAKYALVFSIIAILVHETFSILFSKNIIIFSTRAIPLENHPRYHEVFEIVKNLCNKAKIDLPELYLIPGEDINAFAAGVVGKKIVAVSEGALKHLSREELEGVLAHEISHIKNKDTAYMTFVSVFVGIISFLAEFLMYAPIFASTEEDESPSLISILLGILVAIIMPIVANLLMLAISRQREYLADVSGAMLVGSPDGLISAFKKIKMINEGNIPYSRAIEPLYFVSLEEAFSTHPPIEKRIENLLKTFNRI